MRIAEPWTAELARAKAQLKAGLLMGLESSSARAEQMARHLLAHGRVMPPAELTAKVEAVTAGDVRAFAERLAAGRPAVAVVGAGKQIQGSGRSRRAVRRGLMAKAQRRGAWHS